LNLEDLGWDNQQETHIAADSPDDMIIARIVAVHKERYVVRTPESVFNAEITGNLRFSANSPTDFPAVGDWVMIMTFDESLAIINEVLPRKNILERQSSGKSIEKQLIAANVDCAFIIQAVDRDFNINRIERYLAIAGVSQIEPVVLLSKIDLISDGDLQKMVTDINERHPGLEVICFSNTDERGYSDLNQRLEAGKTHCFLGSSGVGKSTLVNHLLGKELIQTREISTSTGKGKHTTSHRELFLLENGSIVIDTPGMREVGVIESVEESFDLIHELSANCRYADCSHIHEDGCAILDALERNEIHESSYENYLKMRKEAAHFQASSIEKRQKDKEFGKMIKQVLKHKKRNKF